MSVVGQWLRELATARPRFGYERLHVLRPREGWRVGRNRVHRIFKLEELQVLMRLRRRKHIRLHRGPVPVTTNGGQYWAMDFVHDQLASGRKSRVLTVVDKWHRQCLALQADFALTGHCFTESFNGRFRDECLNVNEFSALDDVPRALKRWRDDCYHYRPHGSLGRLNPNEFARRGQESGLEVP